MNSGEIGQEKLNAKATTAEIDRATDLAAEELTESKAQALGIQRPEAYPEQNSNLGRAAAGNLGNRVLTYNPDQEGKAIADTERVLRAAEIDNGYGEAVKSGNESLVGVATELQAKEHLEEDRNMLLTEQGGNGPYAQGIMERNNKRLTNATIARVDQLISENNYHPGKLDEIMSRSRTNFLKDVFNRILGSRN